MLIIIICLLTIIIVLLFFVCLHMREVKHLSDQLEQLNAGSHMELSSKTRNPRFIALYTMLNRLMADTQKKELHYTRSQNRLKQTISSIAHDIRTPLTSAAGYVQMLKDCTTSEKQLRYEHIIEQRIEELKDMLEELFLYTKLTSEEYSPECTATAVFPILSDCMLSLYHIFSEKEVEPDIHFENEAFVIYATPEILGRIFRNLINNALLHGDGGLSIIQSGSSISFCNKVKHTDSLELDRLFERFYKADRSRRKGSSGLGLSIVKELADKIGANISASLDNENVLTITLTFSCPKVSLR